jgi:hypothetical protein
MDIVSIPMIAGMAVAIGSIPYLVKTLLAKDRFLKRLHAECPNLYRRLGRPWGWQWRPPREASHDAGAPARTESGSGDVYFEWLSPAPPGWLEDYLELAEDYRYLRYRVRRWNFVIMPVVAALLVLAIVFHFLSSPWVAS